MLIIFDQATPLPIRSYLKQPTVRTAAQQGWNKLNNGDLLTAAEEAGFDILLTTDKNIRYQQNLAGRKLAIVVLASFNAEFSIVGYVHMNVTGSLQSVHCVSTSARASNA
jgi:hypothetical protein